MEKIREKFTHEAAELIDDLEQAVLHLDNARSDKSIIEEVFRVMHTFKGTAKMFGFDRIGAFTHHLENVFDNIRNGRSSVTDQVVQITLKSVDYLRTIMESGDEKQADVHHQDMLDAVLEISGVDQQDSLNSEHPRSAAMKLYLIRFRPFSNFILDGNNPLYLIEDLSALGNIHVKTCTEDLPDLDQYAVDQSYLYWDIILYTNADAKSIRNEFLFVEEQCELEINPVSDENLLEKNDFISFINASSNLTAAQVRGFGQTDKSKGGDLTAQRRSTNQTIKVTYEKIDKLMGITSELVTTQARLSLFADGTHIQELESITETIEKLVRQLRDETFSISLFPISHLSVRFERLVRDTSRELGKKIRFITSGGDTELDKKIIENLYDPMLHILRNSMDHGIESPELRKKQGKDETGTLHLKSYYSGANVIIEIHDDGAGINKDRVTRKAIQLGLIKDSDQLRDNEIFDLIFHPGFSTANRVTDVSGRGVGMDVVKQAIENLRGEIEVKSTAGKGTVIRLKLPMSLSVIDGLLVKIETSNYVIPLTAINKCYALESHLIKPDMHDLIVLDGEQLPYINLRKELHAAKTRPEQVNLIVTMMEDRKVAFEVDSIVDEYQAVIKPLGKMYKDQEFISGATILGNGSVAMVLDTNKIVAQYSSN